MQKKSLLFFMLSLAAFHAFGQDQLVQAGFIFDSEKGVWLKNQILHIRDGKVFALNPVNPPKNATRLNFQNYYLIPGLIDSHTHLLLEDHSNSKDFAKGTYSFLKSTTPLKRKALGLKRMQSLIASGFTSVRDLGNDGGISLKELENFSTPRIFSSGKGFVPKDGQLPAEIPDKELKSEYSLLHSGPEKVLTDSYIKDMDVLKLYADEEPNPTVTPYPLLKEWVDYGHKQGLVVAVHAIFAPAINNAIKSGADTLEHGYEITNDNLIEMADKKMIFVPTNANVLMKDFTKKFNLIGLPAQLERFCSNIKNASLYKVSVAFGSDNYFSLENYGKSFGSATLECLLHYSSCGLSPAQTLQSATYIASKTMGKENELGSLRPGFHADFIVLKNDPLLNLNELKKPLKVFKGGKEVSHVER